MKLAFINTSYQLGGAETVVQQLHFGSLKAGYKSSLHVALGKYYPRGMGIVPMYPRLLSRLDHTRFHPLIRRWAPRIEWTNRAFRRLAHGPADLIHLHNFYGDYASIESLAYLAARKPVVWTFHNLWGVTGGCGHPGECRRNLDHCGNCPRVDEWPICGIDNTAEQLRLKREMLASAPLRIVSPSRHLAQNITASLVGRHWPVTVIPNGVDPGQFSHQRKHDADFRHSLGLSGDKMTVLIVNRDFRDPLKGFSFLQAALRQVDPAGAEFIFAGANSSWAIQQLPEAFSCIDLGYVSNRARLADVYEAADIFLFASPHENFPCAILEAMSARCCVVSTPTDGVVEQVENGVTGFIADSFAPGDVARALAAAIASPETSRGFAAAARERIMREFTEQTMVERHWKLYDEVLADSASRVPRRPPP